MLLQLIPETKSVEKKFNNRDNNRALLAIHFIKINVSVQHHDEVKSWIYVV